MPSGINPPKGSICVEYPANGKRKADVFADATTYGDRKRPKVPKDLDSLEPWRPFRTRSDYDFAELVFKAALTKDQISSLLSVVNRCIEGDDKLTFGSYADLHDSLKEARNLVEPVCCQYCISFCRFAYA